ncbi:FAD-binding oxidoreductase [Pedobacter nanyangensis]|uniref:FAD-binding oxidoreductase n=1 Tax=Pedobacter nanyangensis TaxID=1562389 RepID=UPI000DE4DBC1|nr:FAD-binding oxidoreductase [Pedobacter nanyangensis]
MPSAPKWLFDVVERLLLPKIPLMEVSIVEQLSPSVKRIQFKGAFETLQFQVGSYLDFRVSGTEARRYTISYIDPQKEILEFIVHLHGEGPGRWFMDRLKIGNKTVVSAPRAHKCYEKSFKKYLVFGDETSLALACSLLPALVSNNHEFSFYFELAQANQDVPELLGIPNCTVFAKNGSFHNEKWISNLPFMESSASNDTAFVLTGNAKSVQVFKKVIKANTKAKIFSQGYWLEGKKGL